MTEAELARLAGLTQSYVNKIKNGTRRPSPQVAARLEAITGIPVLILLKVGMGPGMAMQAGG